MVKHIRRLCFLLVEKDEVGLSPRKLLIESTKHNVLTAFSPEEGLRLRARFPDIDAAAIDAQFGEEMCSQLAQDMKKADPSIKVVAFMASSQESCKWADESTGVHDPKGLLRVLEKMGARTDIA